MSAVVSVDNISKKFCRSLKQGMLYTATDVMHDVVGLRGSAARLRKNEFWAVRDVSLELKRGESLGLIGMNGAGKSSLLKMLNGIVRPDKGVIRMKGRVGALIEVGAGFHPMLNGWENIYANGAILGMNKREIDRKLDSIIDFSGLEPSMLEAPVKTYSSGMYVRLGFAVAVHCEPDILLVDEVLSVGDEVFRMRCAEWLARYLSGDGTLILVSHNLPTVRETCERVLLMEHGHCTFMGDTLTGLRKYQAIMNAQGGKKGRQRDTASDSESPVKITSCQLLDGTTLVPTAEIDHNHGLKVRIETEVTREVRDVHLHVTFTGSTTKVCGWSSRTALPQGFSLQPGRHTLTVNLGAIDLIPGGYSVDAYLSEQQHLVDYAEFRGPSFLVRVHPVADSRFGLMMMTGSFDVA